MKFIFAILRNVCSNTSYNFWWRFLEINRIIRGRFKTLTSNSYDGRGTNRFRDKK